MDWHPWIVYAHVLGAFAFAAGHGVAAVQWSGTLTWMANRAPSDIVT